MAQVRETVSASIDMDFLFDFEEWIVDNKLESIKQAFIDLELCTVQHINFANPNFSKLVSNPRVLASDPSVVPRIIKAVQELRQWHEERTSVFELSNNENDALVQIKHHLQGMHEVRANFKTLVYRYNLKKHQNQQVIAEYSQACNASLQRKHDEVTATFTDLCNVLEAKEESMLKKMSAYMDAFKSFHTDHQRITQALDFKLDETKCTIKDNLRHLEEQEVRCKEILRDFNNHLSARGLQSDRENKILKISEYIQKCYDASLQFIKQNQREIKKFLANDIDFDIDIEKDARIYCIRQNVEAYHSIKQLIPCFIDICCVSDMDINRIDNKEDEKKAGDEETHTESKETQNKDQKLTWQVSSLKGHLKDAHEIIAEMKEKHAAEVHDLKRKLKSAKKQIKKLQGNT